MPHASRMADALCLAAAPTFAILALLTSGFGSPIPDMFCGMASPLGGMSLMYGLMAAFHAPAWLKLIARHHSR